MPKGVYHRKSAKVMKPKPLHQQVQVVVPKQGSVTLRVQVDAEVTVPLNGSSMIDAQHLRMLAVGTLLERGDVEETVKLHILEITT